MQHLHLFITTLLNNFYIFRYYKCFESLDCDKYGNPVLEAVEFSCPLGQVFDQKSESCMDPAKCDMPACGCKSSMAWINWTRNFKDNIVMEDVPTTSHSKLHHIDNDFVV